MTDRPILFSAPMVRALLAGRKTMTRRILKPQPQGIRRATRFGRASWELLPEGNRCSMDFTAPRFTVGDRLWVRETWRQAWPRTDYSAGVIYRADAPKSMGMDEYSDRHKWRVSIHMPRWASRLTLNVTAIKVERLQYISEADAIAEGVDAVSMADVPRQAAWSRRQDFSRLWDSINGGGAWAANPWVVAISFDVIRANIDAPQGTA